MLRCEKIEGFRTSRLLGRVSYPSPRLPSIENNVHAARKLFFFLFILFSPQNYLFFVVEIFNIFVQSDAFVGYFSGVIII